MEVIMGLPLFSKSTYDEPRPTTYVPPKRPRTSPNPDPKNFRILRNFTDGDETGCVLVVEVEYPDATTFEGRKIMVYQGISLEFLEVQGVKFGLDPHFAQNEQLASPVARFIPTEEGWNMAVGFAVLLSRFGSRLKAR
jgi:hypothetical protein